MKKTYHLENELYPILRQLLQDAFHVDSALLKHPYSNIADMDRGFRKAIFKDYSSDDSFLAGHGVNLYNYSFVIIQSTLKFFNLAISFPVDEHPVILSVGPFRNEEVNSAFLQQVILGHNLQTSQTGFLRQFYQSLPLVDTDDITYALLHLLRSFVPEFKDTSPVTINFSEAKGEVDLEPVRLDDFTAEYSASFDKYLKETITAVQSGVTTNAMQAVTLFLNHIGISQMTRIPQLKKYNQLLNNLLYNAVTDTYVHPNHALKLLINYDREIDGTQNYRTLQHMPYDIIHKYTLLIKNYSHQEYSHLVRGIKNYIDMHLEEDLSLTALSEHFHKNSAYISTTFKSEVGTGLANYIKAERIHAAVRLLNTTEMSVADISATVGIQDFNYFTKVFKQQIGQTPTEYRKMMR